MAPQMIPEAQRPRHGFDARLRGQLQQDVLGVRLDRLRCDAELPGDALVRQAVAHQAHDVALARRERLAGAMLASEPPPACAGRSERPMSRLRT